MFADANSSAIVAVNDLVRARAFYTDKLGLALAAEDEQVLTFRTGATSLVVYVSDAAGTNKANAAVWGVGADFDAAVAQLKANGVTFEEYPELGMQVTDGVHTAGELKAAWFKDPDGNILHLNSM
jgi:catechol 2,3-dioxygenase-like lactoylglutathione lyase family enzyme